MDNEIKPLSIYLVEWVERDAGPVSDNGLDLCQTDLWGKEFITATTAKVAKTAVRKARPRASIKNVRKIGKA